MAQREEGAGKLIDEILARLNRSPLFRDGRVWQRDEAPNGAFVLKARCRVEARFAFQVWIKQSPRGIRYSYRILSGNTPILRWDNAPHFPDAENFPHHFHNGKGRRGASALTGDLIRDLETVFIRGRKIL